MDTGTRFAVVAVFVWMGTVLAMSFLEAPLKFRAEGVTPRIGPGIGRLVFRALNACEYVFAIVIAVALFTHETSLGFNIAVLIAVSSLLMQTIVVRPMLSGRTKFVLAGEGDGPRLRAHHVYVAVEVVKLIALIWAGVRLVGA